MSAPRPFAGFDGSVPVLALGGEANTVEMARNLSRLGIVVRVCGAAGCYALWSRDVHEAIAIPDRVPAADFWASLLLAPGPNRFDGHVVMALDDEAIAFVTANATALRRRYRLERFDTALRSALLDKARTLELAASAGVPAPRFWRPDKAAPDRLPDDLAFPVMVKPLHSHLFVRAFGAKLFIVDSGRAALTERLDMAAAAGIDVMVTEMIPGPDDLLSSYYTFIGDDGLAQFHYTKSIVRRLPANRGMAVYHRSEWLPETAEMGLRYLQRIGWRGMANIEFKRDTRDGRLKIIEVNSRLTAAHRLVVRAGVPVDLFIYCDATDQPAPVCRGFRQGLTLWYPFRDFRAFLELRRAGRITLGGWLKSLPVARVSLPLFSLRDPLPSVARIGESLRALGRRFRARVV